MTDETHTIIETWGKDNGFAYYDGNLRDLAQDIERDSFEYECYLEDQLDGVADDMPETEEWAEGLTSALSTLYPDIDDSIVEYLITSTLESFSTETKNALKVILDD